MEKLKEIQKTRGLNDKLVYLNKHTKLFKYNFAFLKYNPTNLSVEEVGVGNNEANRTRNFYWTK
jgi:hypothetical protein